MAAKKGGLGKGLDALFADNFTGGDGSGVLTVRVSDIEPNRDQPRKDFNDESLAELADSILQHGVLQPLIVRELPQGGYQIIAGERRWRASRMAGIKEVPVLLRDYTDRQVMEIALIENLQREDLNAFEEALGYQSLMEEYGLTQEEVAKRVGRSRPAIANALRLLALPGEVAEMVRKNELSAGHARAILAAPEDIDKLTIAKRVVSQGLSVREAEKLAAAAKAAAEQPLQPKPEPKKAARPAYCDEVQIALQAELGRKVKITQSGKKKGTIEIEYYSPEDLFDIANRLGRER